MKAVIGIFVLLGILLGSIYFFGGYKDLDPDQQGRAAKAAIKPGMTMAQVLAAAGETPKYQSISLVKDRDGAAPRPGPEVPFDKAKVQGRISSKQVPQGFNLIYRYSEQVAFLVHFDETGKVESMEDVRTVADLLGTRKE